MSSPVGGRDWSQDDRWSQVEHSRVEAEAAEARSVEHACRAADHVGDLHCGSAAQEAGKAYEAACEAKSHSSDANRAAVEIAQDASRENCTIC
jgi:predicted deacylase